MKPALLAASVAALFITLPTRVSALDRAPAITIGDSDLGGVVTSANGPEAGVWVIAETTDLPTKFVKIVVTDDQGRYVMPDCRRPITTSGCAAMGWSIRRK